MLSEDNWDFMAREEKTGARGLSLERRRAPVFSSRAIKFQLSSGLIQCFMLLGFLESCVRQSFGELCEVKIQVIKQLLHCIKNSCY
jgi:hypothetical protein